MSILLTSTSDELELVTSETIELDVIVCYSDLANSTLTPGVQSTKISSATTTTILSSPAASTTRKVNSIRVQNISELSDGYESIVTLQHTDGTTTVELDERTLTTNEHYYLNSDGTIDEYIENKVAPQYYGNLAAAYGNGDPNNLMQMIQTNGVATGHTTNNSTSVARCCLFKLPFDLDVKRIRYYSGGTTKNEWRIAIYRYSDKKRLTDELELDCIGNYFGTAGPQGHILDLCLQKDVLYFIAITTNNASSLVGPVALGPTIAATTGQIQAAPQSLPGSLDADLGYLDTYCFQFAVTGGALPLTAPTLENQAAWTGGMNAFWLDNNRAE